MKKVATAFSENFFASTKHEWPHNLRSPAGWIATIILETFLIVQAFLSNIYYQTAILSASNNGDNNTKKLKTVEAILN